MVMSTPLPLWTEVFVALLLLASGALALTGAIGLFRYGNFFQRMHPPTLAATLAAACVTLASIIFFSALERLPALYPLPTPVTTVLLARAALQRAREGNADVPPALAVQEPQPPD